MLTIKNLNKKFDKKIIYENLNLELKKGEIFALIGQGKDFSFF